MAVVGAFVALSLALLGAALAALLIVSSWNALREEILPGFRIAPPGARSLALTLIALILPLVLLTLLTGYFAVRALSLIAPR